MRHVALVIALVFIVFFAALTVDAVAQQGLGVAGGHSFILPGARNFPLILPACARSAQSLVVAAAPGKNVLAMGCAALL